MLNVRCSSLPRFMACPASAKFVESGDGYRGRSGPADMGSAVHAVMAEMLSKDLKNLPPLDPYLHQFAIGNENELRVLCLMARQMLDVISANLAFRDPEVEFVSEGDAGGGAMFRLAGHLDILAEENGDTLFIPDWKTGRVTEADYDDQLMGYLYLAWLNYTEYEKARTATMWVRDRVIDIQPREEGRYYQKDDLLGWRHRFFAAVRAASGEHPPYRPGGCCTYCPGWKDCPARAEYHSLALRDMDALPEVDPEADPQACIELAPALALLYPKAKLLETTLRRYDSILRTAIKNGAADLPTGDGRMIGFKESERSELKPTLALPMILKKLDLSSVDALMLAYPGMVEIGLAPLKEAIGDMAQKREKTKTVKAFMAELEAAGALEKRTVQMLTARKI